MERTGIEPALFCLQNRCHPIATCVPYDGLYWCRTNLSGFSVQCFHRISLQPSQAVKSLVDFIIYLLYVIDFLIKCLFLSRRTDTIGLEPTTARLTVGCSTIELHVNKKIVYLKFLSDRRLLCHNPICITIIHLNQLVFRHILWNLSV